MQKLAVTTNGTISHSPNSETSLGTFVITSLPSLASAEGYGIYSGTVSFSFSKGSSSYTNGDIGAVTPGTVSGLGQISPSAIKCFAGGSAIVLDGDSGSFTTLTGTFVTNSGVTSTITLPLTDVEFSSPGQTKVYAS